MSFDSKTAEEFVKKFTELNIGKSMGLKEEEDIKKLVTAQTKTGDGGVD